LDNYKIIDSKKFMWDGEEYDSESAAAENVSAYNNDGFETRLLKDNAKFLVYTRRVVTEVVVDGGPV
jgi:hypothetical protein